MSQPTAVSTPAPEPEFSLDAYRAEREGRAAAPVAPAEPETPPVEPEKEPSAEPEKAPETAPDSEPEDDQQEKEEPAPTKGKGGFQRRIDKLVARNTELERQLAERSAGQPQAPVEQPVVAPGEPQLADFDSVEAWGRAHSKWMVKQELAAERAAATLQQQKQQFDIRLAEARAKYSDFDEAVGDVAVSVAARDFIVSSPVGTDVMYALAQHPVEAAQLAQLPPIEQIKALTILEAHLSVPPPAPETPKQKVTQAPEPIKPVGTSAAVVPTYKQEMSFEEFKQWRNSGGGR